MSYRLRASVGALAACTLFAGLSAALPVRADVLVTAGADKKVKLWNPEDGKLIKEIAAHEGTVNTIALSPNGKVLATGGADKKVKLWNPGDGALIKSIDAHDGAVTALWFSMDSQKLFTGSADKKVKVWNVADGKNESTIAAHEGTVLGVISTPQMVITGGSDGLIRLWDDSGNKTFELEHPGLRTMSINLVDPALYTADKSGAIKWWKPDGTNGDFEGTQGGAINVLVSTPDGKKLLSGGANGIVKVWDIDSAKMVKEVADVHKGGVTAIVITPDGKTIITAGADKTVKLWSADGKLLKTVEKAHEEAVTALLYIATKKEAENNKKPELK